MNPLFLQGKKKKLHEIQNIPKQQLLKDAFTVKKIQ